MENTLLSQIPDEFFKVFASKYRSVYFQSVVGLYDVLVMSGSSSVKGLTASRCREIVYSCCENVALWFFGDDDIENAPNETVQSKIFAKLVEYSWLCARYDDRIGEDFYYFPKYAQMFAALLKDLNRDMAPTSVNIRTIFAEVTAYVSSGKRDIGFLNDAYNNARQMQSACYGAVQDLEAQAKKAIQLENGKEILTNMLAMLTDVDTTYQYQTDNGKFCSYQATIEQNLSSIMDEAYTKLEQLELLYEDTGDRNTQLEIEELEKVIEKASDILGSVTDAFKSIKEYNKLGTEIVLRALARIKYMRSDLARGTSKMIVDTINVLAKERRTARQPATKLANELLGFSVEKEPYLSKPIYVPKETVDKSITYFVSEEEKPLGDTSLPILDAKTEALCKEFERKHSTGGTFRIGAGDIGTTEDLDIFATLYINTTGVRGKGTTISVGEQVEVEDGFSYPEVSWKSEVEKC